MTPQRFVLASDPHGKLACKRTVSALFRFMDDYQPSIVINMGDNWDFASIRRGASDEEKAESLEQDFKAGEAFMLRLFAYGRTRVLLRGNHDERLWDMRESCSGVKRDYADAGIDRITALVKRCGATMLPYDSRAGIYKMGDRNIVHGYRHGANASREHARIFKRCAHGHVHRDAHHITDDIDHSDAVSIPCLCGLNPPYMRASTAKLGWSNGWGFGLLHADGRTEVYTAKESGGKFYAVKDFKGY
jgi:hypothetical protein